MKKTKVYAYYFPNWHVDSRNEQWHGKGWTEWEVAKCARPRFEGHEQPKIPLWGYEDEADPKVMEKKIACAKEYCVDGFIFDAYYYDDGPHRERCLNEGFLGAKNNEDFEFAVMWCDHDHTYTHPSPRVFIAPKLKDSYVNEEQFITLTDHYIKDYFSRPNYIRVDGKILFIIFDVWKLRKEWGEAETRRIFDGFRQRVRDAGLGEMQLTCVTEKIAENFDEFNPEDKKELNRVIHALGIDEGIRYWWPIVDKNYFGLTNDYKDMLEPGIGTFQRDKDLFEIPVDLDVMIGIDQSPRTIQSEVYETLNVYPYFPIAVNNTPELFEVGMKAAKEYAEREDYKGHFIGVTWNEWTEGHYLEPDTKDGYARLEAIRRVMKGESK